MGTPRHVRNEWASQHGLSNLAGSEFDDALEEVSGRIGAAVPKPPHCGSNKLLVGGLQALGKKASL